MSASERDAVPRAAPATSASRPAAAAGDGAARGAGVSMRDLLAACAAAKAVSTPPHEPDPATCEPARNGPWAA